MADHIPRYHTRISNLARMAQHLIAITREGNSICVTCHGKPVFHIVPLPVPIETDLTVRLAAIELPLEAATPQRAKRAAADPGNMKTGINPQWLEDCTDYPEFRQQQLAADRSIPESRILIRWLKANPDKAEIVGWKMPP